MRQGLDAFQDALVVGVDQHVADISWVISATALFASNASQRPQARRIHQIDSAPRTTDEAALAQVTQHP